MALDFSARVALAFLKNHPGVAERRTPFLL
jgi:hypothetical protein